MGEVPVMTRSSVEFNGVGNVLFCEKGVTLRDSRIEFNGSGGLVYLSSSKHSICAEVFVWNDSTFFLGGNSYINPGEPLHAIASERRSIFIGDDALISFGVWMRTADPHLVYSVHDLRRINQSKSIVVGDHVWLGQQAMLLKGTVVGSGSIVSARAVCAGKRIPSNTSWAGNPARQISKDVFFSKQSAHAFDAERTKHFETFRKRDYIFRPSRSAADVLAEVDGILSPDDSPSQRAERLGALHLGDVDHDRFAVAAERSEGTLTGLFCRRRARL